MVGTTVGQYRITRKIGAGGMGVVYLAEHALLGRLAAVKLLLPEYSQDRVVVSRFFNEAKAATSIRHPGIVEIYDFGFEADGSAYIIMEYLEGETLTRRAKSGLLSHEGALAIVRQIASALAAAHAKGIVHRDLKPDNVFLVPDPDVYGGERIKLLDFGIAKLIPPPRSDGSLDGERDEGEPEELQHLTHTGAVMGTPSYMAPEQCRGVTVDHRADLYSLGCILFRLCAGRPPFTGQGTGDILAAHIHVPPPSLASVAPGVTREIDQLVARLLVKDPAQRLGTAEEVIRAIEQANSGPGYRTSPHLPGIFSAPSHPEVPTMATLTTLSEGAGSIGDLSMPEVSIERPRQGFGRIAAIGGAVVLVGVVAILALGGNKNGQDSGKAASARLSGEADREGAAGGAGELAAVTGSAAGSGSGSATGSATAAGSGSGSATGSATAAGSASASVTPSSVPPASVPPSSVPPSSSDRTVAPAAAEVTLVIDTIPDGATLLLDGAVLGTTPYRGALPRSGAPAALLVRRAGYKDRKLVVRPSAPIAESVKLEKKRSGGRPASAKDRDIVVNPFSR